MTKLRFKWLHSPTYLEHRILSPLFEKTFHLAFKLQIQLINNEDIRT